MLSRASLKVRPTRRRQSNASSRTSVLPASLPRSGVTISRRKVTIPRASAHMRRPLIFMLAVLRSRLASTNQNRGLAWLNNKHACDEVICVINIDLAPAILPCCFTRVKQLRGVLRPPTRFVRAGAEGEKRPSKLLAVTPAPLDETLQKRSSARALLSPIITRSTHVLRRNCNIPPQFPFRSTSFSDTSSHSLPRMLTRGDNVTNANRISSR